MLPLLATIPMLHVGSLAGTTEECVVRPSQVNEHTVPAGRLLVARANVCVSEDVDKYSNFALPHEVAFSVTSSPVENVNPGRVRWTVSFTASAKE